jgi:hypothetical protein
MLGEVIADADDRVQIDCASREEEEEEGKEEKGPAVAGSDAFEEWEDIVHHDHKSEQLSSRLRHDVCHADARRLFKSMRREETRRIFITLGGWWCLLT